MSALVARLCGVLLFLLAAGYALTLAGMAQTDAPLVAPLSVALPLANETTDGVGCKDTATLQDENARAYAEILETRFNTAVTLCLTETHAEAVDLGIRGDASFVWSDQSSVAPLLGSWRPALTLREFSGLGRAPFVVFGTKDDAAGDMLSSLNASEIGFLDRPPLSLNVDLALRLLNDYGISQPEDGQLRRFPNRADLFEAIESGDVDAAILEGGAWGRACAVLDSTSRVCDHLNVYIFDRPRALGAFMIPNDMDKERHFRLVGVHIALHLEHPEVFAWLSQGQGPEYEPTEATAILPKSIENAVVL